MVLCNCNKSITCCANTLYKTLGTPLQSICLGVDCTRCEVFHRDAGPCVKFGWMFFRWWTILDTHRTLLSVKNAAALQFLTQTGASGTYYHTPFKGTKIFWSCPITLWMAHKQCLKALKSMNLCPPLQLHRFWRGFNRWSQEELAFTWRVCHRCQLIPWGQSVCWFSLVPCTWLMN
jgi:hypothetical protein